MALPVAAILVMQACMSFRLLNAASASGDEALYIYSGHQLIYEMWHGGGSPYYENYFSGAPVLYPVLAAVLDHIGGLVLARIASGVFMLTATGLLFATARHLFGYWPAVIAAGLFAALGITQGLGAYATFDAPALMLIAFAAYCAVRAADTARWLLAIPVLLVLANATKYASFLFDPVVILLAGLTLRAEGWRRVGHRASTLAGVTVSILAITIVLAGTAYFHGILFTTVARKTGTGILNLNPANTPAILMYSWDRIGLILVFGALAMIVALAVPRERSSIPLLALLVMAGLLVTLEAIHLQDLTSVNKHDDFGTWFTAIAAGYALARGAELIRSRYAQAASGHISPLGGACRVAFLRQPRADRPGRRHARRQPDRAVPAGELLDQYLMGGKLDEAILYNFHLPIPWWRVTTDSYVKYPIPGRGGNAGGSTPGRVCNVLAPGCVYLQGPAAARAAIRDHWFAVVSFIGQNHLPIDGLELDTVRTTPGYLLVSTADGPTYIYVPDFPTTSSPQS